MTGPDIAREDVGAIVDPATVAVVVVNFRSTELLRSGFAGFVGDLAPRVVVVDNHSSDAEADRVTALARERGWQAVLSPTNRGFGAGVNAGVEAAFRSGATTVVLANPDLVIAPKDVLGLAARCTGRRAVSPAIVRPDGRPWFVGAEVDLTTGRTRVERAPRVGARTSPWLSGACLAFDRATWDLGGGLDERYFMYWEDVELGHRWSRRGIELAVASDLTAVHDPGGTQGSSWRKSALYYRFNCRNRLYFAADHLSRGAASRWVLGAPAYALEVLLRGGRRQFLTHPVLVLSAVGGTLEGVARVVRPRGRRSVLRG